MKILSFVFKLEFSHFFDVQMVRPIDALEFIPQIKRKNDALFDKEMCYCYYCNLPKIYILRSLSSQLMFVVVIVLIILEMGSIGDH